MKKELTQEQMNEIFEKSTTLERSKISFIQIIISTFCINSRESLEQGKGEEFLRDFTETLMYRKKMNESIASTIAFEFLARSYAYIQSLSERGKKGGSKRWNNPSTLESDQPPFTQETPF